MGHNHRALAAGLALAGSVLPAAANANDTPTTTTPRGGEITAPQANPPSSSDDIVVTAQKRSENVLKVPISITVQTQAQMDAKGLRTFNDLARTVPGLNFNSQNDTDQPNVSINGIVSTVGSATTGVYLDDTPIASRYICFYCGFTAFPSLFDLERVEVLRGPQGTLFGAGSEGGTIRFITPKPSLTSWSGYSRADLGFTKGGQPSWEIGSAIGGPIIEDVLGFRASFWTRRQGGYIDRLDRFSGDVTDKNENHGNDYVGRVAVTWKPTDSLTITPSVFFQKNDQANRSAYWEEAGLFKSYNRIAQPVNDRQVIGSITVDYDLDWATLTSVTSYYNRKQRRIDDYTPSDLVYYAGVQDYIPNLPNYTDPSHITTGQRSWTQELRIATDPTRRLSFTGGLYFMSSRTSFDQKTGADMGDLTEAVYGASVEDIFGAPLANGYAYIDQEDQVDREYAIFGEADYKLTDRLKLALGGRFSYADFNLNVFRDGAENGGVLRVRRTGNAKPFNPRASLSYQLNQLNFYATVSKGYRVGGGNAPVSQIALCGPDLQAINRDDVPGTYKPDHVWNYEVGAKGKIGGAVTFSGSLFYVQWKDIQANVILPTCGYSYTANTGSAVSKGFEVEGSWRPLPGLTLAGNLGYTDAYYTRDILSGPTVIIAKGTSLSTPKWQATISGDYEKAISSSTKAYLHGDLQYASSYTRGYSPASISYDPDTNRIESMKFVSARTGVRFAGVDASIYVNNLLNSHPILTRYHDLVGTEALRDITLRPRTIGGAVSYRF